MGIGAVVLFCLDGIMAGNAVPLLRAFEAGTATWMVMRLVEHATTGAMGGGDTRLHAVIGLHTGWSSWHTMMTGFLFGYVVLATVAALMLITGRCGRSDRLAAGPALIGGAWIATVLFPS